MWFPGSSAQVLQLKSILAPCCRELCSNSCLGRPGNSPPVPEVSQVGHPPPFFLSKARWIASLRAICLSSETLAGPATGVTGGAAAALAFFGMVVARGMCAKGCVQSTLGRCATLPKEHKCFLDSRLCKACYMVFVLDLIWYTYDIYIYIYYRYYMYKFISHMDSFTYDF